MIEKRRVRFVQIAAGLSGQLYALDSGGSVWNTSGYKITDNDGRLVLVWEKIESPMEEHKIMGAGDVGRPPALPPSGGPHEK